MDDPLIRLELHASTVDLLHALLTALEAMSQGAGSSLTAEQQSYLAQAMDIAADLDIVFGELADAATSVLDRSEVIRSVCDALSDDRDDAARAIIKQQWPFVPIVSAGRRYTYTQRVRIFLRDGCIDRYKGHRLVFPGTLRLLSLRFPQELPFQPHWKMNECHQMWWELYPTIDHVVPIARGGVDDETNWVCVSMLTNAIKANWTLDELNWKSPLVPGQLAEWDGLTRWFLNQLDAHPELRPGDPPLRDWERAARLALA